MCDASVLVREGLYVCVSVILTCAQLYPKADIHYCFHYLGSLSVYKTTKNHCILLLSTHSWQWLTLLWVWEHCVLWAIELCLCSLLASLSISRLLLHHWCFFSKISFLQQWRTDFFWVCLKVYCNLFEVQLDLDSQVALLLCAKPRRKQRFSRFTPDNV